MWKLTLIFFSSVAVQAASHEIRVECREHDEFPTFSNVSPSLLANLTVQVLTQGGNHVLNISWAVNIDASIRCLTGTHLVIDGEQYLCEYNPNLAEAKLTGSKQIWFHHLVEIGYGNVLIQVGNLPLPPPGSKAAYKTFTTYIPKNIPLTVSNQSTPKNTTTTATTLGGVSSVKPTPSLSRPEYVPIAIFGGLAGLLILCSCYISYKNCRVDIAKTFGFKQLPTSPVVPVPVLMVYAAENSAFQQAVVALAEFLQRHGGCKVAVDMWQQRKIAELGPMRWLVEQVKVAEHVLIVCPQVEIPSHSPPIHSFPEPSIPATAPDLYHLILNMVASHAKSASELAKFWVVQLGEQKDKMPNNLALELRACKTFCLMSNLDKLCRSLHTKRSDNKILDLIFRPGIPYSRRSTVKLREAVEKLRHQPSTSSVMEPLKSVVISV